MAKMVNVTKLLNRSTEEGRENIDIGAFYYGIINAQQYAHYQRAMIGVYILVLVVVIVSNALNVRTFYVLGLKDSVTVSFFALSIFDLLYGLVSLLMRIYHVMNILEAEGVTWFTVHPSVYMTYTANASFMTAAMGMSCVTFVSVARCLCVALPLRFRHIFTTSRSLAAIMTFTLFPIAAWAPIFANMGVRYRFDARKNATRGFLWVSADRDRIKDAVLLVFDSLLPVLVEVILITCVAVMTLKLRESAKFRNQSSHGMTKTATRATKATKTTQATEGTHVEESSSTKMDNIDDTDYSEAANNKLSARDLRIVHQVILISVVYIVCTCPKIFNSVYSLVQPEFAVDRRFHYFYYVMNGIRLFFDCINACANFFVYFSYNHAFRHACFTRSMRT